MERQNIHEKERIRELLEENIDETRDTLVKHKKKVLFM